MRTRQLLLFFALVFAIGVSMVMTWAHLNTSGSILLAVLIHLMANHGGDQFSASFNQTGLGFLFATGLVLGFARRRFAERPAAAPSGGEG